MDAEPPIVQEKLPVERLVRKALRAGEIIGRPGIWKQGKPRTLPVFYEVLCDSGGKCVYAGNRPRHSAPLSDT